jgi:hypothetical protein
MVCGLIGIHVNMPATVPPGIARALKARNVFEEEPAWTVHYG